MTWQMRQKLCHLDQNEYFQEDCINNANSDDSSIVQSNRNAASGGLVTSSSDEMTAPEDANNTIFEMN